MVSLLLKSEEIKFQPSQVISEEKIIYSSLNSTVIQLIKAKALFTAIREWDWYEILQYLALGVHVGIFPIALVSCCVSLKALHAFRPIKQSLKMLKRSHNKDALPMTRRTNYVQNKKYVKKILQQ